MYTLILLLLVLAALLFGFYHGLLFKHPTQTSEEETQAVSFEPVSLATPVSKKKKKKYVDFTSLNEEKTAAMQTVQKEVAVVEKEVQTLADAVREHVQPAEQTNEAESALDHSVI